MKNNEFTCYLENLLQEARTLNPLEGEPGKAWFQGAVTGILACEEDYTFTGRQVAKIIETVLDYEKDPGNEGSTGQRK